MLERLRNRFRQRPKEAAPPTADNWITSRTKKYALYPDPLGMGFMLFNTIRSTTPLVSESRVEETQHFVDHKLSKREKRFLDRKYQKISAMDETLTIFDPSS